jgi:hypothetical protein
VIVVTKSAELHSHADSVSALRNAESTFIPLLSKAQFPPGPAVHARKTPCRLHLSDVPPERMILESSVIWDTTPCNPLKVN